MEVIVSNYLSDENFREFIIITTQNNQQSLSMLGYRLKLTGYQKYMRLLSSFGLNRSGRVNLNVIDTDFITFSVK